MYSLAGFVFLLTFVAFANGESCNQITQCVNYAQNIRTAAESGNTALLCENQKKMVDCFSSALEDCQKAGSSFPQGTLEQFQNTMSEARKQYEKICPAQGGSSGSGSSGSGSSGGNTGGGDGGMTYGGSGGSVPETASCIDAAKCGFDIMKVQKALNDKNLKEVCAIVKPSAKCMKSAYNDCKKNKVLPEQQLNAMSEQVQQVDTILGEHCGACGIGASTVYMTLISALAFIVLRLF